MKKSKNTTFSRFNLVLIVQVLLIAIIPLVIIWTILKAQLLLTPIGLTLFWILQIIYLIYYLSRIKRDLTRFLIAFKHDDSTIVFNTENRDSSFKDLYSGFNNILGSFENIKIEKEKDFFFFQNVIEHVGIGLLSYNDSGRILLTNKAFKDLFNIYHLREVDHLEKIKHELPDLIRGMKNGEQKQIKIVTGSKIFQLSIKSSDFKICNDSIRIISFQDIKNEIEQSEMEAWQKLIRVLSHEIMNSVSPITLLSRSLIQQFEIEGRSKQAKDIAEVEVENLLKGLHTINLRSRGLAKFVENYRNLTQLSKPNFRNVSINRLFGEIETLFREEMRISEIIFEVSSPPNMYHSADKELLDQVIINLIRNSIQATKTVRNPKISLISVHDDDDIVIKVSDNGTGISEDHLESIFIPFFTTKKDGSGIGLSLSRQIMRLHNGIISVESKENEGAIFSLQF